MASGTFDRSHGVFFTLHPSSQESLQKSRPFVCQFEVPAGFRADYIQMTCTATGHNRGVVRSLDTEVTAGMARYTIGIYRDGDRQAKAAADLLAQRQQELTQAMLRQAEAAKRGEPAHWWESVGKTLLTVSHMKSPEGLRPPATWPRPRPRSKTRSGGCVRSMVRQGRTDCKWRLCGFVKRAVRPASKLAHRDRFTAQVGRLDQSGSSWQPRTRPKRSLVKRNAAGDRGFTAEQADHVPPPGGFALIPVAQLGVVGAGAGDS